MGGTNCPYPSDMPANGSSPREKFLGTSENTRGWISDGLRKLDLSHRAIANGWGTTSVFHQTFPRKIIFWEFCQKLRPHPSRWDKIPYLSADCLGRLPYKLKPVKSQLVWFGLTCYLFAQLECHLYFDIQRTEEYRYVILTCRAVRSKRFASQALVQHSPILISDRLWNDKSFSLKYCDIVKWHHRIFLLNKEIIWFAIIMHLETLIT